MEKASDKQVGGSHYKDMPIEPSEFCQKNGLNWCEANVVKYVCRHKVKNGRQDIEKAIHYLQLLLEWEYEVVPPVQPFGKAPIACQPVPSTNLCSSCQLTRPACGANLVVGDVCFCLNFVPRVPTTPTVAPDAPSTIPCSSCQRFPATCGHDASAFCHGYHSVMLTEPPSPRGPKPPEDHP